MTVLKHTQQIIQTVKVICLSHSLQFVPVFNTDIY
jgi:hypothetical protein